ncbi:uncharacterized protein N7518_008806 [Penicillium psychrosexuale]|uniref:uncharacterized protein n=1 Tax=Penicillium psychrosexuale TaxID=1002107 RepID=UPI0025452C38|nr:uncharacterized protein N7518_008806 [Penicillium psychrosexuale]KAJ5791795.1 hypothetical protein N7518_008806 [Penicillium psychrosexuale]
MAPKTANFVKENYLDGVDIDWEYPGAPDTPGIPSDDEDSGDNYLTFLVSQEPPSRKIGLNRGRRVVLPQ